LPQRKDGFVTHSIESAIVRRIFALYIRRARRERKSPGFETSVLSHVATAKQWTRWQVLAIIQRKDLNERGTLRYGFVVATNGRVALLRKDSAA